VDVHVTRIWQAYASVELMAQRGVVLTKVHRRPRPAGVGETFIRMAAAHLRKQVATKFSEACACTVRTRQRPVAELASAARLTARLSAQAALF
jgi:hypothetical protein